MFEGFGAILERLQGLLGKGYLLTGFFPTILMAVASVPLVLLIAPESPFWFNDFLSLSIVEQGLVALGLVLVAAFVGLVLYLLNPSFRRRLESGILRLLGPWFIYWQQDRAQKLKNAIEKQRPDLVGYRLNVRDPKWRLALRQAHIKGRGGAKNPVTADLLNGIEAMERHRAKRDSVPFEFAQSIFDLMVKELESNDAEEIPELDQAQVRFWDLAVYASKAAEVAFNQMYHRLRRQFPRDLANVGPTALANLNRAHEDAIWERYRMNGELFWPIVERVASRDQHFADVLREARLHLDFLVSITAASLIFTIGWLIGLYLGHGPRWAICLLAIGGPLATALFYWVTFWNAYSLNAIVRMTIDLFRFNTLAALHISLPNDSSAETDLWSRLTALEELTEGRVDFCHDGATIQDAARSAVFE
jgi:hypothetical protein